MKRLTLLVVLLVGAIAFAQNTAVQTEKTPAKSVAVKKGKPAGTAKADSSRIADSLARVKAVADSARQADSLKGLEAAAVPAEGQIKITTEPSDAQILVDSAAVNNSPVTVTNVKPGRHVVIIKKSGYFLKKAEVNVDSGKTTELTVSLSRPGGLVVTSAPSGAVVTFDGKSAGVTPFENQKLKPGQHTVKVELAAYEPVEQTVTVNEGVLDSLKISLLHTKAYQDSVSAALKNSKQSNNVVNIVITAVFAAFVMVLVVLEANGK